MRILVLTYAFPPMHVQMTSASLKPIAGLAKIGAFADVLTVKNFPRVLPRNSDLCAYAESIFDRKIYADGARKYFSPTLKLGGILRLPDLMASFGREMLGTLLDLDLRQYAAVLTWSPFHSINHVMMQLKVHRPEVKWIAQFSDPWANNPLEETWRTNRWSAYFEPRMIEAADAIVHSSAYSMELMARNASEVCRRKFTVIGHCYDPALYGEAPVRNPDKIVVRHIGTLFGRRTPEPFFRSVALLLKRRPELATKLSIELVGAIGAGMLASEAARQLPKGLIRSIPKVGYVELLGYMRSADLLVLIEADVKHNLFLPSKLADYIGSGTPILGLVPPGGSMDVLNAMRCWNAKPGDVEGISHALEQALDHVQNTPEARWCDDKFQRSLSPEAVAMEYRAVIERVVA